VIIGPTSGLLAAVHERLEVTPDATGVAGGLHPVGNVGAIVGVVRIAGGRMRPERRRHDRIDEEIGDRDAARGNLIRRGYTFDGDDHPLGSKREPFVEHQRPADVDVAVPVGQQPVDQCDVG